MLGYSLLCRGEACRGEACRGQACRALWQAAGVCRESMRPCLHPPLLLVGSRQALDHQLPKPLAAEMVIGPRAMGGLLSMLLTRALLKRSPVLSPRLLVL